MPWQQIIEFQRDIYLSFAEHIKSFAAGGGWFAFLTLLPMGVAFGAAHALTPGHSKSVLATYLTGSSMKAHKALLVSMALSFTHVSMAGLIPCPLTLFVMTFAMIHQVIITGLLFALSMMLGVCVTLSAVAILAVMFREQLARLLSTRPRLLAVVSKSIEAVAGAILVAVALHEIVFA
ncbi:ABC transporter permease [Rhizobium ruizarguesonis]|uniref:ABC transporter permease n=1 Tax=Rhizobium ruizarguesonis TaxID=2081791 RepID=UPI001030EAFF|nr:ABC transporter permease [Rhizobium ruizarguesonis]TAY91790.1 ABC transporter permease [Rhizobium ruizarguesonis]